MNIRVAYVIALHLSSQLHARRRNARRQWTVVRLRTLLVALAGTHKLARGILDGICLSWLVCLFGEDKMTNLQVIEPNAFQLFYFILLVIF